MTTLQAIQARLDADYECYHSPLDDLRRLLEVVRVYQEAMEKVVSAPSWEYHLAQDSARTALARAAEILGGEG
jgi:hypothetical protein